MRIATNTAPHLERGAAIEATLNGEKLVSYEGETIAASLVGAGILALRSTMGRGEPRGMYCGIGLCHECLVTVDGLPNVRACLTPVRNGMRIETSVGSGTGEQEK